MKNLPEEQIHTAEQRERMLKDMREASAAFYAAAIDIGNHAFIEFTGFMNEYIKLCEQAHDRGRDFTAANVHCGSRLIDMAPHEARYLGEKFGCVFSTIFKGNPEATQAFCDEAFGRGVVTVNKEIYCGEEEVASE